MKKLFATAMIATFAFGFITNVANAHDLCEVIAITQDGEEYVIGSGDSIEEAREQIVSPDNVVEVFEVCE